MHSNQCKDLSFRKDKEKIKIKRISRKSQQPDINAIDPLSLKLGAILGRGNPLSIGHSVLKHPLVCYRIVVVKQLPLALFLVMRVKPLIPQLTLVIVNPISVLLPVQELTLVLALWIAQLARACVLAVLVQESLVDVVVVAARPLHHALFLFVVRVNA